MAKNVAFKTPGQPQQSDPAEAWVKSREPDTPPPASPAAPTEPMKRFTIDVPESLHKRIKIRCAMDGRKMTDVLREMFEREFPVKS